MIRQEILERIRNARVPCQPSLAIERLPPILSVEKIGD
jgi:hypothetical protein